MSEANKQQWMIAAWFWFVMSIVLFVFLITQ